MTSNTWPPRLEQANHGLGVPGRRQIGKGNRVSAERLHDQRSVAFTFGSRERNPCVYGSCVCLERNHLVQISHHFNQNARRQERRKIHNQKNYQTAFGKNNQELFSGGKRKKKLCCLCTSGSKRSSLELPKTHASYPKAVNSLKQCSRFSLGHNSQ
jgi:hypothetical protein